MSNTSTFKCIIVESPYAGDVEQNTLYAQRAMKYCLLHQEAPYASHLLYTQPNVLDDDKPNERDLGIHAGFAFKHLPNVHTTFFTDYGMSSGMELALTYLKLNNLPFSFRKIGKNKE